MAPGGMFDLGRAAEKRRQAEAANEKAPDDLSELLWCPTCGHTALGGVLESRGKWLRCIECHFSVTDNDSVRIWLTTKEKTE